MNKVVVKFAKVRETKNAVLFDEVRGSDSELKVGSFYVKKATFGERIPSFVTATIEWQ